MSLKASEVVEMLSQKIAEHGDFELRVILAEYYEGWSGPATELQVRDAYDFENPESTPEHPVKIGVFV